MYVCIIMDGGESVHVTTYGCHMCMVVHITMKLNPVKLHSAAPEMTAFDVNATYLKIEWRATTFANRYRVELTSDGFNNTSTTTNLLATFTLQPKTMYRVRVWAVDSLSPPRLGDVSDTLFGTPALGMLSVHTICYCILLY